VLTGLEAAGLRGLILDLRSNTGGLLDSAINVTDKFIKGGWIVRTRPRYGFGTDAVARGRGTHPDYPLAILVNSISASASEIVAGALADRVHRRAVLVGERTHGKGSVQGIIPYLKGGAQLKYTMAYYILPSGQRVESRDVMKKLGREDWGVAPNIQIKLRSDEIKKRLDAQKDNDVLVKADHQDLAEPLKKRTAAETITADPQLAVGILVIRTKMIEQSEKLEAKSNKRNGFHLLTVSLN
jgi:carboxyl-terminal processing protease